jgi:hypothetical protein
VLNLNRGALSDETSATFFERGEIDPGCAPAETLAAALRGA